MSSISNEQVSRLLLELAELEESFQRLDSNDIRAQTVRDARHTIAALQIERTHLRHRLVRVVSLDEHFEVVDPLRRWKDEASSVLAEWEAVWIAAGRPGPLGRSKAQNTAAEIARLKSEAVPATSAVSDLGDAWVSVQAWFNDDLDAWVFYEDPDVETDWPAGLAAATIPRGLWERFERNNFENDALVSDMVALANLHPEVGRRPGWCDQFTGDDPDEICTVCGWWKTHHDPGVSS